LSLLLLSIIVEKGCREKMMRYRYPAKALLQKRAEQCRHIADGMKDAEVRRRLNELARDYERMASETRKLKRSGQIVTLH
jgi:hypothetical protein